jgi:murein DD-endopeptidase MepM/ murein hydrolase activator NlpD
MLRLYLAFVLLLISLAKPTDPEMPNEMMCPIISCIVKESRLFDKITHRGIDIESSMSTPVRAANGGVVYLSGRSWDEDPDWIANRIVIDHGNDLFTGYWHLDEMLVSTGDYVYKGQIIGKSGQTGWASWPHLHFLVLQNGIHQDPSEYININIVED